MTACGKMMLKHIISILSKHKTCFLKNYKNMDVFSLKMTITMFLKNKSKNSQLVLFGVDVFLRIGQSMSYLSNWLLWFRIRQYLIACLRCEISCTVFVVSTHPVCLIICVNLIWFEIKFCWEIIIFVVFFI